MYCYWLCLAAHHSLTIPFQRDTLIRYLLDELYSYEEDHTDALCPIQREVDKSHAGEAALVQPLRTDEARRMFEMQTTYTRAAVHEATFSAISTVRGVWPQTSPLYPGCPTTPKPIVLPPPCPSHLSIDRRGILIPLPGYQQATHNVATPCSRPAPVPSRIIPKVPDGEDGWKQVVRDWEYADPSRSLLVPLKDWPADWYSRSASASTTLGSLRNHRKIIATEFIDT
jgi:hypothetical protein